MPLKCFSFFNTKQIQNKKLVNGLICILFHNLVFSLFFLNGTNFSLGCVFDIQCVHIYFSLVCGSIVTIVCVFVLFLHYHNLLEFMHNEVAGNSHCDFHCTESFFSCKKVQPLFDRLCSNFQNWIMKVTFYKNNLYFFHFHA